MNETDYEKQKNCEHTIRWGMASGICTKCNQYFELDLELQDTSAFDGDY